MRRWTGPIVALALLVGAERGAAFDSTYPPHTAVLRFAPEAILAEVARRMDIRLRPEIAVPPVLLESLTPLARFQDAVQSQWGIRPQAFVNVYVVARNEIYLIDDAAYYARLGMTIEDSLAHEFVHFLQSKYLGYDLDEPWLEHAAVQIQLGFQRDFAQQPELSAPAAPGSASRVRRAPLRRRSSTRRARPSPARAASAPRCRSTRPRAGAAG